MRGRSGPVVVATLVALALWGGVAGAHVTISPASLPQGTSDAVLTLRVPNESATATVTGLRVQLPLQHPIVVVAPEAGSGWSVAVHSTRLSRSITTSDGTFTSTVSEIDWSGSTIPVGQFAEFNVLAQGIPTGTSQLEFKAIEQYSDGTSVSWIQIPDRAAPDPPHPAPIVALTAPNGGTPVPSTPAAAATAGTVAGAVSSGGSNGLAVASLIAAGFAVLLALLAVWLGRPKLIEAASWDGEPSADRGDELVQQGRSR